MAFDYVDREASDRLLARLTAWWASRPDLANRPRIPLGDWLALSPSERSAVWQVGIDAVHNIPELNDVRVPLWALGRRLYEPAVPLLIDLWRRCAVQPIADPAGTALFAIGSPRARAELREGINDRDFHARHLALKTMFTDPTGAWAAASWLFDLERLETEEGVLVAQEALGLLGPNTFSREGPHWNVESAKDLIANDPRWLDLCVRLRTDAALSRAARNALRYVDPTITTPALDSAATKASAVPRPTRLPLRAGSLLARYEAGDHLAVWRELAEADPQDKEWRAEGQLVADATMRRVRRNAERLVDALVAQGWPVARGDALRSPEVDVDEALAALEQLSGAPVPPALSAFWRIVGGIDLVPWGKQELPQPLPARLIHLDPLEIDSSRIVRYTIDEWRSQNEGVHREIALPIELQLSADSLHKADISGGAPYSIWLPSTSADPIVHDEPHDLRFTDYLRLAFGEAGFVLRREPPVDAEAEAWLASLELELEPF
jgi:hypothetical protein